MFDGFTHLCIELTVVSLLVTLILALTPPLESVHQHILSFRKEQILNDRELYQIIPVVDLAVAIPVEGVLLPATLRGGTCGGGRHLQVPSGDQAFVSSGVVVIRCPHHPLIECM